MEFVLAAVLIVVLLAFFGCAVWISYLVVFRGWRIYQLPPAAGTGSDNKSPAGSGRGGQGTRPGAQPSKPGSPSTGDSRPGAARQGKPGQPPRQRRQGRR